MTPLVDASEFLCVLPKKAGAGHPALTSWTRARDPLILDQIHFWLYKLYRI